MANNNIRSLSSRKGLEENLFEKIATLAEKDGSENDFHQLSKEFYVDDSVVLGTASFYDFIKPGERKKQVRLCNGTACMVAGTQGKLSSLLHDHFSGEEIGEVACVGHCHSNHAILYGDRTYSVNSTDRLNKILSLNNEEGLFQNIYHIESNTVPVLTGPIIDIVDFFKQAEHYREKKEEITEQLKLSKLRGRGGAGFPFWFKLDAVSKEVSPQKYIVCNADEGDPGAYSDMYLMEHQPFKVLYGIYAAGICVGADTGVIYIRGEYPESIRTMESAINHLIDHQLVKDFKFKIIKGKGSYVCGEETALLNSIEGLRPEVRVRPPYPAQYGLFGKPTVLSNVETFANIHWILEKGGIEFAALGTPESSGTKLVSLDSFFNRPGVYEIEMGTPLIEVINDYGKGVKTEIKAFQIGGPLGGIIPFEMTQNLSLDFESLAKAGFLLGHASVVSIPSEFPMIRFITHLLKFTSDESCGKCYPCRIGSHRGYEMLKMAQDDNYKIDRQLFDDLIETLEIGSLCALGGGVPLPVKNALKYFGTELKTYFKT